METVCRLEAENERLRAVLAQVAELASLFQGKARPADRVEAARQIIEMAQAALRAEGVPQ